MHMASLSGGQTPNGGGHFRRTHNMKTINLHKIGQTVDVDYDALTDEVKGFVINYGLTQILNDAMSGVKVGRGGTATEEQVAEGLKLAQGRLTALTEGKLRQRVASAKAPADPVAKRALEIAEGKVRASAGFKAWLEAHKPPVKEANAQVRKNAEKVAPNFMDLARKQLDDEAKATAKLGGDEDFSFETPAEAAA
jgi:hypothetical protein